MNLLKPVKYLFGHIKNSLSNIKTIIKKPIILLPTIIISIIWAVLSYLVAKGHTSQTIYILSIITFAQGGMYGGLIGTIGGIIGKGIIATFITKLFNKSKNAQKIKIKGTGIIALLIGAGLALVLYNFLSTNASLENSIIGVTLLFTIFKATKNPNGFWYEFPMSFSKKISREQVKSLLNGMSYGLILGVIISCILIKANYIPYIVGACLIALSIIVKMIKKPKVVVSILLIAYSFAIGINYVSASAFSRNDKIPGLNTEYTISGIEIIDSETSSDYYGEVTEMDAKYTGDEIVIKGSVTNTQYVGFLNINTIYDGVKNKKEIKNFTGETREFEVVIPLNSNDDSVYIDISGIVYGKDWETNAKYDKFQVKISITKSNSNTQSNSTIVIEEDSNDVSDTFHKDVEETLLVSLLSGVGSLIFVFLSSGISGGSNVSVPEETYILKDPASGAETEYVKDPTTGQWISRDGSSILDDEKIPDWQRQRGNDKEWMDEQKEKESAIAKDNKEMIKKNNEELEQMEEDILRREKEFRDYLYECSRFRRDYYERRAASYKALGDVMKTSEVTAIAVSAVADAAIDVYGATNPLFAKKYKLLKGALGGVAENGLNGLVSGTINGGADALLVGKKGVAGKAIIRFSSRFVTGTANSAIKGKSLEDSLKNGMADGIIHASGGAIMDATTGKLVKLDSSVWKSTTVLTKDTTVLLGKELLGTTHGGLQRTLVRGTSNMIVKPFVKDK